MTVEPTTHLFLYFHDYDEGAIRDTLEKVRSFAGGGDAYLVPAADHFAADRCIVPVTSSALLEALTRHIEDLPNIAATSPWAGPLAGTAQLPGTQTQASRDSAKLVVVFGTQAAMTVTETTALIRGVPGVTGLHRLPDFAEWLATVDPAYSLDDVESRIEHLPGVLQTIRRSP